MQFYQFAYKNLIRSKTRTALTVLSVTLTAFILFMVLSLDRGFESSVKENLVDGIGSHLFIARGGCPMDAASIIAQGGISPMYIPEAVYEKTKDVAGIRHTMPFKIFSITTSDGTRTDIFCGLTKEVERIKTKWKYAAGGWFKDGNSVILGADIAAIEKRKAGEKIYVEHFGREFEVAGILEYAFNQDDGMFFLPLKTAQKLINREGKLSAIAVSVKDLDDLGAVRADIKARLPDDYMVLTPEAIGSDVVKFYNSTRVIMFAILFFTLFVSAAGISSTIVAMIHERRKEFAYLKCVGAGFLDTYKLILQETFMICLAGVSSGLLLALLLSNLFQEYVRESMLSSYIPKTAEIIRPGLDIAVFTALTIMAIGLLAATYPAIRLSRIMPMEAIRND